MDFDAVDDGDDGGIHRDVLQALGVAGGAALAEQHQFAFAGTDGVDGDDGVLAVLEFGRVLVVDQLGPEQEQCPADHELVLLGGDDLSDDFREEHGVMGLPMADGEVSGWARR